MPGLEFATGTLALPAWAAGAALALFVVIALLALTRSGASVAGAILRVTFVIAGGAAVLLLLQQGALRVRSDSDMHTLGYPFRPWKEVAAFNSCSHFSRSCSSASSYFSKGERAVKDSSMVSLAAFSRFSSTSMRR